MKGALKTWECFTFSVLSHSPSLFSLQTENWKQKIQLFTENKYSFSLKTKKNSWKNVTKLNYLKFVRSICSMGNEGPGGGLGHAHFYLRPRSGQFKKWACPIPPPAYGDASLSLVLLRDAPHLLSSYDNFIHLPCALINVFDWCMPIWFWHLSTNLLVPPP